MRRFYLILIVLIQLLIPRSYGIVVSSINGNTITTGSGTLTLMNGSILSIPFSGTLGTAAYTGTGSYDVYGAADSARAFAIQRSNHTGTQSPSTISTGTFNIGTVVQDLSITNNGSSLTYYDKNHVLQTFGCGLVSATSTFPGIVVTLGGGGTTLLISGTASLTGTSLSPGQSLVVTGSNGVYTVTLSGSPTIASNSLSLGGTSASLWLTTAQAFANFAVYSSYSSMLNITALDTSTTIRAYPVINMNNFNNGTLYNPGGYIDMHGGYVGYNSGAGGLMTFGGTGNSTYGGSVMTFGGGAPGGDVSTYGGSDISQPGGSLDLSAGGKSVITHGYSPLNGWVIAYNGSAFVPTAPATSGTAAVLTGTISTNQVLDPVPYNSGTTVYSGTFNRLNGVLQSGTVSTSGTINTPIGGITGSQLELWIRVSGTASQSLTLPSSVLLPSDSGLSPTQTMAGNKLYILKMMHNGVNWMLVSRMGGY